MKKCIEPGCNSDQFGGQRCHYHQFRRKMRGGDLYKPKSRKSKPIPKESKKRKTEHKTYLKEIDEHRKESKENGTYFCWFCGEAEDLRTKDKWLCNHHAQGRTGKYYLDKKFWRWAHNDCHNKYTFGTVEQLQEEDWYEGWLGRLKEEDEILWRRDIKKIEKSLDN